MEYQLLPTEKNLAEVLDKLLSVFECEDIQPSGRLPAHPIQREQQGDEPGPRSKLRPMSGNDFHVKPSISFSPSWEAVLQFAKSVSDGSSNLESRLLVQVTRLNSQPAQKEEALELIRQLASLLKTHWPDATVGLSRRKQLGPQFTDSESADYQIFRWLASKQLNPVSEGVFLIDLLILDDALLQDQQEWSRGLTLRETPQGEWKGISVGSVNSTPPANQPLQWLGPIPGQLWSFCGPSSNWVISLPVLATLLLLMSHPGKASKEGNLPQDCPDRDLSWVIDSLQGFCRLRGPEEGDRTLSSILGTYPDHWMHLHFVGHTFYPLANETERAEWEGNGIRCERRKLSVPIGSDGEEVKFLEERVWVGVRTAVGSSLAKNRNVPTTPTVAFVLSDSGHQACHLTPAVWALRGLEPVRGGEGVVLFQTLIWSGADAWNNNWIRSLDYIDRLHKPQLGELHDASTIHDSKWMSDESGVLSKAYFMTGHFLRILQEHIDVFPAEVRRMERVWLRAYPLVLLPEKEDSQRFQLNDRLKLGRNWCKVMAHVDTLHQTLSKRIETRISELQNLRNTLLLEKIGRQMSRVPI